MITQHDACRKPAALHLKHAALGHAGELAGGDADEGRQQVLDERRHDAAADAGRVAQRLRLDGDQGVQQLQRGIAQAPRRQRVVPHRPVAEEEPARASRMSLAVRAFRA